MDVAAAPAQATSSSSCDQATTSVSNLIYDVLLDEERLRDSAESESKAMDRLSGAVDGDLVKRRSKHPLRFLLRAEPQIGKTGTYAAVALQLLRAVGCDLFKFGVT
jgi:hypothetical protein